MGLFLFVAAVKGKKPLEVGASIRIFLDQLGFKTEVKNIQKWREEIKDKSTFDVIDPPAITAIFNDIDGFTVISFDNCPFQEYEVSKWISNQLKTVVSLIEVYDSITWYHRLFLNGSLIDQFCNNPEDLEDFGVSLRLKGDSVILSKNFQVNNEIIEDYMFQFTSENRDMNFLRKLDENDEYALGDEWFFTDFWRKLGIIYPESNPEIILLHKMK